MEHWATTAEIKDAARVVRRAGDTQAIRKGVSDVDDPKVDNQNESPPLQPIAIPTGWTVAYNDFRAVDPGPGLEQHFGEDLLQLVNLDSGYIIDLGWYPESNVLRGEYALFVIRQGQDWDAGKVHEFRTRDRARVVEEIERSLCKYMRPSSEPSRSV